MVCFKGNRKQLFYVPRVTETFVEFENSKWLKQLPFGLVFLQYFLVLAKGRSSLYGTNAKFHESQSCDWNISDVINPKKKNLEETRGVTYCFQSFSGLNGLKFIYHRTETRRIFCSFYKIANSFHILVTSSISLYSMINRKWRYKRQNVSAFWEQMRLVQSYVI